jgi:probable HAF family extracellular repeat protein
LAVLATHPSESVAISVSNDGAVIVGLSGTFPSTQAFRWTAGTMQPLGFLPGYTQASSANSISGDGSTIVGWAYNGTNFIGLRSVGGVNTALPDLPGAVNDSATGGVNGDGSIIAGRGVSPGFTYEACRWENGGAAIPMGDLPGGAAFSSVEQVSDDGMVFVGFANSGSQTGGLWGEAARWVRGGPAQSLGDLPGGAHNGYAYGVSGDGAVIVGYSHSALGQEAFIWDESNGMRNLREVLESDHGIDMTGWTLTNAAEVSADGNRIVGVGLNPSGLTEAWVVVFGCDEPGDADGDGDVDFADLNLLLDQWQTAGPEADLDGSGFVDFSDLNLLLSRWGNAC